MIGQQEMLTKINKLVENNFPRFVVITGQKGQGKKYIANIIAEKLHYPLVIAENIKIDTIRELIDLSYKQTEPVIYLIADADTMSIGAKNSLLKVIEEPPNNAYWILTLEQLQNTLDTIKSRCIELPMDKYSVIDINKFIDDIDSNISSIDRTIITDTAKNNYQVKQLLSYNPSDFYKYCEKVVSHIHLVQSANSFKIAEKLALKDENGYDIKLFLETCKIIYMDRCIGYADNIYNAPELEKCANSITATSEIIKKLTINGINKTALIDSWILTVRKIWRD